VRKHVLLLGALLLWPAASRAADKNQPLDVRLGIWEITAVSDVSGIEIPPEELAKMPPEMRAKAEAALKASTPKGPTTTTRKSCVTEKLTITSMFGDTAKSNCRRTTLTSTASRLDFHEECADSSEKTSSADLHFEAIDSTHINGSVRSAVGHYGGGQLMRMNLNVNARWLGPDCSELKNGR
jgi:hypothetical protein